MAYTLTNLDNKIIENFGGRIVRKDLVKAVKGNAVVPSYVLEYLLGQYCATSDEETILSGIETVKEILAKHYVHRNEAGLVRSKIREKGRLKVIDKIAVDLNTKLDIYEATFSNLQINGVCVGTETVKKHKKLLVGGVWCIADLEYEFAEDKKNPWILSSLKPVQITDFNYDEYLANRKNFSTEEWIDAILQSIGFNPEFMGQRSKLLQLVRLIPFCERNYNLIELGPKGTGKSHVYSEFSPHGMLISGGEVTAPKLFVENRKPYKIGLVGYWDCVAFDEFAGKKKKVDKGLVDIMKNYMANKTFSRGVEPMGAEASMAFVGNTKSTVPYMLRHTDLFEELPDKYHDSAFLDRIHFYIPGWEVDIIRNELFTSGFGFVVDYLAEVLKSKRDQDLSHLYREHFELSDQISTRDRDGIKKTFSGLMKIIFPNKDATKDEIAWLLQFSMEGRKRVKDQVMRIDPTFNEVDFHYEDKAGNKTQVKTLEEQQYPNLYFNNVKSTDGTVTTEDPTPEPIATEATTGAAPTDLTPTQSPEPGHIEVLENQKGISFDKLFGPYLTGATNIVVTDPYVRKFHQARNFMEFLETVAKFTGGENVNVKLITVEEESIKEDQISFFNQMQISCNGTGINFSYEFEPSSSIHARHIVSDNGWKITLDRGLDVFQHFDSRDQFSFATRLQEQRACKPFEVTYIEQKKS